MLFEVNRFDITIVFCQDISIATQRIHRNRQYKQARMKRPGKVEEETEGQQCIFGLKTVKLQSNETTATQKSSGPKIGVEQNPR